MYLNTLEKILITFLSIVLIIMTSLVLFFSSIYHFYYDKIEQLKNPEFQCINETYNIYITNEIPPEYEKEINNIEEYIEKIPLYKNNYYIILTEEDLSYNIRYSTLYEIVGTTNNAKKIIKIKYGNIEYALFHEIGHAVDDTYGFSKTEEFNTLYNKVKPETQFIPKTLDEYMILDIEEYFAENFSRYLKGMIEDQELIEYFNNIATAHTNNSD